MQARASLAYVHILVSNSRILVDETEDSRPSGIRFGMLQTFPKYSLSQLVVPTHSKGTQKAGLIIVRPKKTVVNLTMLRVE